MKPTLLPEGNRCYLHRFNPSCPYYAKVTPHPTGFEESIVRWRDRARRANEQKFIPGRTRSVRLASRYREVTVEVLFYFIPSMKIIHTYFFC